ncbi:site-specific integrase [Mangrovimonas futianensis]|uniref:site-specific integrase n=1 Tax=Mangrovimonas futianensis TaxID=2895523 RepID=UPI001E4BB247|nr:site-specific integrase [Mangrovimonas futianensis]MCF1420844.1 site-specific integrase [Mangrovimonas futianensis]
MSSIKILLRNKPNKQGLYPVILKIIKDRKVKIISLGLECQLNEWDEENFCFKKNHKNSIQRNRILLKLKDRALQIIDDYRIDGVDYSLKQFEQKFRGKSTSNSRVFDFWEEQIEDKMLTGRTGSAKVGKDTLRTLSQYYKKSDLEFKDITPYFLNKFETYLRKRGYSDGGLGVRMRELRALFNKAIENGIVEEKYYPFKKYKVSKFKSGNVKRALTREQVKKIENLDISNHPHLLNAKNYFLFSYYTRGMNFYDMMFLKWSNINNDRILYKRSKTKGHFSIKIIEPIREILAFYKAQNRPTDYVFPILLNNKMTPQQIENRKHKILSRYNRRLSQMAKILEIETNISSYTARHSFATNLKYGGISTDVISELLGHRDVKITQSYLKDFEDDILDNAIDKLLEEPQPLLVVA